MIDICKDSSSIILRAFYLSGTALLLSTTATVCVCVAFFFSLTELSSGFFSTPDGNNLVLVLKEACGIDRDNPKR